MLRKLNISDIFKVSKIIKKMGVKIETENKTQSQLGAELILSMFENIHLAESEISEWMGSLAGITAEEFKNQDIEKTIEMISELKQLSGITNFFKSASR
jgi:hypothetical protein